MFKVIGGTYREICLEPKWDQLFGSGFRAAVAGSSIVREACGQQVNLETWVADAQRHTMQVWASHFEIGVSIHERAEAIEFQYEHGLSIPRIYPDPSHITGIAPQTIEADNALLFGVLEDNSSQSAITAIAKGLVYDPQAGTQSVPFSHTMSKAGRLAIVANLSEVEAMVRALKLEINGEDHRPIAVGKAILVHENAEVVVVKNGAEGAFVITREDAHHVSSYKTNHLFKLGSGDVFSGVFAAFWLELNADPVEAAERASAAAAYYCDRGGLHGLPIPSDYDTVLAARIEQHRIPIRSTDTPRKSVYIAGPLFNFQQRWFINEVRRCLAKHGVKTFSPYHDVGPAAKETDHAEATRITRADIEGLEQSAAVFAIVDGLDGGTLFEVGYAVAKGIPVIAFGQSTGKEDLLMIEGSPGCRLFDDFPTAIYHAAWTALES
ncbi:MAG: nucleoside 2-deoxyribosyltransferase [Planctomycetes bacterium]|nr:nucleoside 2-deoxyribosyltransferase [Planctomycetota bacterium]